MDTKPITKFQQDILIDLCAGGRLFVHNSPERTERVFNDSRGNTHYLTKTTFRRLIEQALVEQIASPYIDTEAYGITEKGIHAVAQIGYEINKKFSKPDPKHDISHFLKAAKFLHCKPIN